MSELPWVSIEEFEQLGGEEKPYREYWYGDVFRKTGGTSIHGVTQMQLCLMIYRQGWVVLPEVTLKLSRFAWPVPDLIASDDKFEGDYPTLPFPLCAEILVEEDDLRKVFSKAAHYLDWGIEAVWIVDPIGRRAFVMSQGEPAPVEKGEHETLTGPRGLAISLAELFEQVEKAFR